MSTSPRRARFVEEYLLDSNGAQAAIRAGYSARSATVTASRLLADDKVRSEIDRRRLALTETINAKAEDVIRTLALLVNSDVRHFVVDVETGRLALAPGAPDDAWKAVASVKYKTRTMGRGETATVYREIEVRLWDKTAATRQLGEHFKLYTQKVEHEVPAGTGVLAVPVPITDAQWAAAAASQQAALLAKPGHASAQPM